MAPYHGQLWLKDRDQAYELINHGRTALALQERPADARAMGIDPCTVLDFDGCEAYLQNPDCVTGEWESILDDGYVWFPGPHQGINALSVPDAANLDIVGDITLAVKYRPVDWTPASTQFLMFKGGSWSVGGMAYLLAHQQNGIPLLVIDDTIGGVLVSVPAPTAATASGAVDADGWLTMAVTLDVNNGASGRTTRWYTSADDGNTWSPWGTAITTAGVVAIRATTQDLQIGGRSSIDTATLQGDMQWAQIRNGIGAGGIPGGTLVFEAWMHNLTEGAASFVANTGQVVTLLRAGATPTSIVGRHLGAAPWHNAAYPESFDALGFWIEEWTGLDEAHVVRPIATRSRGGQLGVLGARERVMKLNVLALATSEKGLEYMYRWLGSTLMNVCATCATDSIWLRRYCRTAANLAQNPSFEIDANADGLADGWTISSTGAPTSLSQTIESGGRRGGKLQRINATISAGQSRWLYDTTYRPVKPGDVVTVSSWVRGTTPNCGARAAIHWHGLANAFITGTSGTPVPASPDWSRREVVGVAPAGATSYRIIPVEVVYMSGAGNSCVVDVDDAVVAVNGELPEQFTTDTDWSGVAELREVGLVEGLQWETDPVDTNRCKIRRFSFTLAAGDPCMYLPREDGPTWSAANVATCLTNTFTDPTRPDCRPDCSELVSQCRTTATFDLDPLGAGGIVVQLENTTAYHTLPVRLLAYADPLRIGVSPSPCGLHILGEIYLEAIPPGGVVTWDVAGKRILYRDHTTGQDVDGHGMIDVNDPPIQRYFAAPCGRTHVVMELGNACLSKPGADWYYYDLVLGPTPTYPVPTLWLQDRVGCP